MPSWSRATPAPSRFVVYLVILAAVVVFLTGSALGVAVTDSAASTPDGQQLDPITAQAVSETAQAHSGTAQFTALSEPLVMGAAPDELPTRENRTTFHVELQSSGDASWQVSETFNITTDEEAEAFEQLGQQFEEGEFDELWLPVFELAVDEVDESTDRSMRLSDESRTSTVRGEGVNRTGELLLSFTWESFGSVEDNRLIIDEEVLTLQSGDLWFPGLTADQQLTIRPPEGYAVDDATIAPTGSSLIWTGPVEFDELSLQATFLGNSGSDSTDRITDENGNGEEGLALLPWLFVGAIFAITLVLALVGYRRGGLVVLDDYLDGDSEQATETKEGKRVDVEDATQTETTTADGPEAASDDEIDVELLSDEERVERLLENNGGRMKQADIVKETDWSNAKVSQLLSAMDEDDRIDKLRIGRENLISFPDENVADFDSNK